MADKKNFECPRCGMIFNDITEEVDFNHRLEHHGWVTPMPDPHYLACKDATREERNAFKDAKQKVKKLNEEAVRKMAALNRNIIAEGFEGKGKEQLGM